MKVLHCVTVPNATSKCQTLPSLYNRMKLIGSLCLNVGKQTVSPYFKMSRLQVILPAGLQECKKAKLQECWKAGELESMTACYQNILPV